MSRREKNRKRKNIKIKGNKKYISKKKRLNKENTISNFKLQLPKNLNDYFIGKLFKKHRSFGFVEPLSPDELNKLNNEFNVKFSNFREDLYISKRHLRSANDGDIVLVKILDFSKNYEGEVCKILKRDTSNIIGVYEAYNGFGFVVPYKKGLATDIYIPFKDSLKAKTGDIVLVKITKYAILNKKIEGAILKIISNQDDPLMDFKLILAENNILKDFPDKVKKELQNIPESVGNEEIKFRKDYTHLKTYTIDGDDAKDFDDAISIEKLDHSFKLYVHIADVSEYIKEGSELDQEARLRSFSIYLINKVIPMLPFEISNNICSLVAGKIRLTMTTEIEIDFNGNILSSNISESYIIVDRKMTYSIVQDILDGKIDDIEKDEFFNMKELAEILKKRRVKEGYINFSIPEPKLVADDMGNIIEIKKEERRFSDEIIEQFMILNNEIVAEYVQKNKLPSIYRIHETPDVSRILEIADILKNLGHEISFLNDNKYNEVKKEYNKKKNDKEKGIVGLSDEDKEYFNSKVNITSKEYASYIDTLNGNELQDIISSLMLRTMKLAKYSNINIGHFGLGLRNYLHFTAPIRRYSDLLVHRILKRYLRGTLGINDIQKYSREVQKVSEDVTNNEIKITNMEREYISSKIAEYMEDKVGNEYEGQIISITSFAIFIRILDVVEGSFRYSEEEYIFNDNIKEVKNINTGKVYKIGDKVNIKVSNVDTLKATIDFDII